MKKFRSVKLSGASFLKGFSFRSLRSVRHMRPRTTLRKLGISLRRK